MRSWVGLMTLATVAARESESDRKKNSKAALAPQPVAVGSGLNEIRAIRGRFSRSSRGISGTVVTDRTNDVRHFFGSDLLDHN